MAETRVDEFLAHHGIKGQKWGVRREKTGHISVASSKQLKPRDRKAKDLYKSAANYSRAVQKDPSSFELAEAKGQLRRALKRVNSMPKFKGVNLNDPINSDIRTAYHEEVRNQTVGAFRKANRNVSRVKKTALGVAVYVTLTSGVPVAALFANSYEAGLLQHDDDNYDLIFKPVFDDNGHVIDYEVEEVGVIKHHGILGMRWGVRRSRAQLASGHTETVMKRKRGADKVAKPSRKIRKDLKAQKKFNKGASEDAQKAKTYQLKAKHGGVKQLTNQELSALNQRLQLEKTYSQLTPKQKSRGKQLLAATMTVDKALRKRTKKGILEHLIDLGIAGAQKRTASKAAKAAYEAQKRYKGGKELVKFGTKS